MKKVFLIISSVLFISLSANCQWYQKNFGVDDPGQLSTEQLNKALKKSKDGVTTGIILTAFGSIGIITGACLFLKDYPDEKYPDQAEIGKKSQGIILALVSIPPEVIGLSLLKENRLRKSEIERFIINMEMKIVLINSPAEQVFAGSSGNFFPCFSFTIGF
jgi:hypothetical protein